MTETAKTAIFVAAAAVAVTLAVFARPSAAPVKEDDVVGKQVAPDFKDPLAVTSMEIIDYDQETGTPKRFKVAKVKGVWSLPSRYDYPADAQEQLATAATSLSDLQILQVATNTPSEYGMYGVIEPATAEPGVEGVGKHVILAGEGGKKLLDVVIGKEVKDSPELRYVRPADKSAVYVVKANTDKLTTKFDAWIEKDLLKLNGWDISRIFVNNYSIDEVNRRQVPGDVVDLTYNESEQKWSLADLKEGEELDTTKLNELKTALDDLKIVDVRRKPAGLSRDLKTEEGINLDEQTLSSLISKGYYPTQSGDLLSNEGEIVVGTKEGVQYVLRFGETALGTETGDDAPSDASKAGDAAEGEAKGANRYLFLMAQFDPSLLEKPDLTPIPGETPAEAAPAAEAATATEEAAPAEPGAEAAPAEEAAAEEASPEATPAEAAPSETPDETKAEPAPSEGPAAPEGEEENQETTPAAAETPAEPAASEPAAETPAETPAEAAPAEAAEASSLPPDEPKTPEQIAAIKAENKRKQDEYDAKIKAGQAKVKELNDRFADWYYVISDDIYKKIKLHRTDAMKKPEGATEKDSPGEFDQLKEGLIPAAPGAPAP